MITATTPGGAGGMKPDIIGASVAAQILGVSPLYVARLSREGHLPAVERTLGGHRRYRRSDVEALRDQRTERAVGRAAAALLLAHGSQPTPGHPWTCPLCGAHHEAAPTNGATP